MFYNYFGKPLVTPNWRRQRWCPDVAKGQKPLPQRWLVCLLPPHPTCLLARGCIGLTGSPLHTSSLLYFQHPFITKMPCLHLIGNTSNLPSQQMATTKSLLFCRTVYKRCLTSRLGSLQMEWKGEFTFHSHVHHRDPLNSQQVWRRSNHFYCDSLGVAA